MKKIRVFLSAILSAALLHAYAVEPPVKKSTTFTFPAGKVIEVALFSIAPGKESVVNQDYFPKVFPVAQEYGLTTSQVFMVAENTFDGAPAQMVGFFVWDSYEQKEKFIRDPRYLKLRNIRNSGMNFLYMGYFEVEQSITYTFDDETIYDFAAMWIDLSNAAKLDEYFEKVAPVAMEKYGYAPIAELKPLSEPTHGKYTPSVIGLAAWGSEDAFDKLQKDKMYREHVHLRDEAVPYKDVYKLKAIIQ